MRDRNGATTGRQWAAAEGRFRLLTLGAALGWLGYVLVTTFLLH